VAQTATPFLRRAAAITGEEFIEWDADDLVGITINLIDQGYMKGHIAMERRILVLPKTEPFGFTKISDVRANSRVRGVQMYSFASKHNLIVELRTTTTDLRKFRRFPKKEQRTFRSLDRTNCLQPNEIPHLA